jgi:hypothetical protein
MSWRISLVYARPVPFNGSIRRIVRRVVTRVPVGPSRNADVSGGVQRGIETDGLRSTFQSVSLAD